MLHGELTKNARVLEMEKNIKVQIVPGGEYVDAVDVPVTASNETWSQYTLEDGTIIRVRQVILQIARVLNRYDNEGNPIYFSKAQPVLSIYYVRDELKKGYKSK